MATQQSFDSRARPSSTQNGALVNQGVPVTSAPDSQGRPAPDTQGRPHVQQAERPGDHDSPQNVSRDTSKAYRTQSQRDDIDRQGRSQLPAEDTRGGRLDIESGQSSSHSPSNN